MLGEGSKELRRGALRGASPFEWLYLAIGLVCIVQYRWIFDDSFVYYRYVDNALFTGAGLTANAGEFVEGYSSPFHVLALLLARGAGLSYPVINVGFGCAVFTLFWWLSCALNRRLTPPSARTARAINAPLLLLAANYSFGSFFTAGNEGAWMHLAAVLTGLYVCSPASRAWAFALAWTPMMRPEFAVALGICALWGWLRTQRFPKTLLLTALVVNGAWIGFRVGYYADLLPNTYYLKTGSEPLEGTSLEAGLIYLSDATRPYGTGFVLAGLLALLGWCARRVSVRQGLDLSARAVMWLIALCIGGWVVASGGSAMHYYYLAFPLTLALLSFGGVLEVLCARAPQVPVAVLVLACFALAGSRYPSSLSTHPILRKERMATLPSKTVMTDPSFFRHRVALPDQWPTRDEMRAFAPRLASEGYPSVSEIAWCNAVYANYDVRSVHAFGLTDAVLARVRAPEIKRGHKPALRPMALDLMAVQLRKGGGAVIGPGVYTDAIKARTAPEWMQRNAEAIRVIERKIFNRHRFMENVRLAFTFPQKIEP